MEIEIFRVFSSPAYRDAVSDAQMENRLLSNAIINMCYGFIFKLNGLQADKAATNKYKSLHFIRFSFGRFEGFCLRSHTHSVIFVLHQFSIWAWTIYKCWWETKQCKEQCTLFASTMFISFLWHFSYVCRFFLCSSHLPECITLNYIYWFAVSSATYYHISGVCFFSAGISFVPWNVYSWHWWECPFWCTHSDGNGERIMREATKKQYRTLKPKLFEKQRKTVHHHRGGLLT